MLVGEIGNTHLTEILPVSVQQWHLEAGIIRSPYTPVLD